MYHEVLKAYCLLNELHLSYVQTRAYHMKNTKQGVFVY